MSRKHSKPLTISEAVGAANNAPLSFSCQAPLYSHRSVTGRYDGRPPTWTKPLPLYKF